MEEIIVKLQMPSFWFTGIFYLFLGIIIKFLLAMIPDAIRRYSRNSSAKSLRKIKNIRWNPYSVQYQIAIDRSFFLVFILICILYCILLVASPLTALLKQNFWVGMLLTLPIYVTEILWLNKASYVKQLIERAGKIA